MSTTKNYDTASYSQYTAKQDADKAINMLKGILAGINIDGVITEQEIAELSQWCAKYESLIRRKPFKEFMRQIKSAIKNGEITTEFIEDLYWLCQKYERGNVFYDAHTADLQVLQGICHGILADGVITDDEIVQLHKWLTANEHLATYYPYDELVGLLTAILRDNKIEEHERDELAAFINEFTALADTKTAQKVNTIAENTQVHGICAVAPDIIFENKKFLFTGISERFKRSELIEKVAIAGGTIAKSVGTADYLVVCDNGNKSWAYACYGRKVEQAIKIRKSGGNIVIVHEFDFLDAIEDAK